MLFPFLTERSIALIGRHCQRGGGGSGDASGGGRGGGDAPVAQVVMSTAGERDGGGRWRGVTKRMVMFLQCNDGVVNVTPTGSSGGIRGSSGFGGGGMDSSAIGPSSPMRNLFRVKIFNARRYW